MNILSKCFLMGLFSLVHFQLATVLEFQPEKEFGNKFEGYAETNNSRTIRKARASLYNSTVLDEQFEEFCGRFGHQPCTCYYPDHSHVVKFELGTDEFTKNATDVNGTGPGSCQDLKVLGYTLEGFYMVRFNSKRIKTINCNFVNETIENVTKHEKNIKEKLLKEVDSRRPGKSVIRLCGGVRGKQCTYLYSDHPDAQQMKDLKADRKNPSSCEDLQLIGHTLQGFYAVRLNTIKVKIVYCDFKNQTKDDFKAANMASISSLGGRNKPFYCNGLGNQPCSCYYSKFQKILQFELGNDDRTTEALLNGPTNCKDLETIGHNLKGFYMVRTNAMVLKIIFCEFHQTSMKKYDSRLLLQITTASYETFVAPMTTLIDYLGRKSSKDNDNILQNNVTSASYTTLMNEGTPKNNPKMSNSGDITPSTAMTTSKTHIPLSNSDQKPGSFAKPLKITQVNQKDGKSYLLMNKRNRCISSGLLNPNGPHESDCSPNEKYHLWKWCYGDKICNHLGKFLSKKFEGTTNDGNGNKKKLFVIKLLDLDTSEYVDQKWRASEVGQLVDGSGLCLGVQYKSEDSQNLLLEVDSCTKKDDGQFWSFASSLVENPTSPVNEFSKMTQVNPKDGESYILMNQHHKCIFGKRLNQVNVQLVHTNCNPYEKEQIWKWNGGNLFNDLGYITKSLKGKTRGLSIFEVRLMFRVTDQKWNDQKWSATDKNKIVSSDGLYLSVDKNSDAPAAILSTSSCDLKEEGQLWCFMDTN